MQSSLFYIHAKLIHYFRTVYLPPFSTTFNGFATAEPEEYILTVMDKEEKNLEEEIQALKDALQNHEDTDPTYMNEEMKELRHYVMYTHLRMEESLGHLITRNILTPFLPSDNTFNEEHRRAFTTGTASVIHIDYYRKVEVAHSSNLIDSHVRTLMEQVNNLRKYFSHPSEYYSKLAELRDNRTKYKEALIQLVEAHKEMNKIFVKFLPANKTA